MLSTYLNHTTNNRSTTMASTIKTPNNLNIIKTPSSLKHPLDAGREILAGSKQATELLVETLKKAASISRDVSFFKPSDDNSKKICEQAKKTNDSLGRMSKEFGVAPTPSLSPAGFGLGTSSDHTND